MGTSAHLLGLGNRKASPTDFLHAVPRGGTARALVRALGFGLEYKFVHLAVRWYVRHE